MKKIFLFSLLFYIVSAFCPVKAQDPGDLDLDFGYNGFRFIGYNDMTVKANVTGLQSDGKIIMAGYVDSLQHTDIIVSRLDTEGYVDYAFGDDGFKTFHFNTMDEILDMVILDDDHIILAGYTGGNTGRLDYSGVFMKLEPDGSVDETFGTDGVVEISLDEQTYVNGLSLQNDGKIIVCGHVVNTTDGVDAFVGRFNANGTPDMSFDTDGYCYFDYYDTDIFEAVRIQSDGRIIAAGSVFNVGDLRETLVARFNTDGSIDVSFNESGYIATSVYDFEYPKSVLVQDDGKIVTGGSAYSTVTNKYVMILSRFNADGTLDNSFAYNGYISFGGDYDTKGYDVILQPDDKIIASGQYTVDAGDYSAFVMIRLNTSDGFPDNGFGTNGWVITPFDYSIAAAKSMVLQDDGKLLAAGFAYRDATEHFDMAIARYYTGLYSSVKENNADFTNLYFSPNPATDQIKIYIPGAEAQHAQVGIFELTGKKIQEFSSIIQNDIIHFNVASINEGCYILKINTIKQHYSDKLIIRR